MVSVGVGVPPKRLMEIGGLQFVTPMNVGFLKWHALINEEREVEKREEPF